MTDTQDLNKNDLPTLTRTKAWHRRWWVGLLAVCLLAVGVYVFVIRAGEAPSRTAAPSPPLIPVVAAPARRRDMSVYLTGLGAVTPLNTVTTEAADECCTHMRIRVMLNESALPTVIFERAILLSEGLSSSSQTPSAWVASQPSVSPTARPDGILTPVE
jgi:hypothetical protein